MHERVDFDIHGNRNYYRYSNLDTATVDADTSLHQVAGAAV